IFQFLFPFLFMVFYLLFTYLVDSHFFLLSYIIQDTSSRDNLAKPLSFYGCLRKSVLLMKERRGRYVLLSFFLASFGGLIGLGTHLLMDLIRQYIGPLLGELDDLLGLIQMIPVLVFSSFYCVFVLVVRTVFADTLMENDAEVVDFGD
ncbi:hypothetical protein K1I58_12425, partial [Streptococcus sanguinis]|nr:hypothetical protein [Streptococcus sanguinis]